MCNDITETTSTTNSYFVICYLISNKDSFISLQNVSTFCEDVVYCILHVCHYSNINFRHFHFFELLLLVSGKSFRYHFDDLLQDNYNSTEFIFDDTNCRPILMLKSCLNENSIDRYRGFRETGGSGQETSHQRSFLVSQMASK